MFPFPSIIRYTWISKILNCKKLNYRIWQDRRRVVLPSYSCGSCDHVYTGEMYGCGNAQVTPDAGPAQAHLQTALNIYSFQKRQWRTAGRLLFMKAVLMRKPAPLQKTVFIVPGFQSMNSNLFLNHKSLYSHVTLSTLLLGSRFLICKMDMKNYRNKQVIICKALKMCLCALKLGVSAM